MKTPLLATLVILGTLLVSACLTPPKSGERPDGLFLGDLHPEKARVSWGDYQVNFYPDHGVAKVLLDGKPCKYFLFAHANSAATYKIPDGMKTFTAVGIRPSGNDGIAGTFTFEVLVDGKSLFKSEALKSYPGYQVPISIILPEGAERIELKTDSLGNGFADHSIWAHPFFHKATNLPY
jgi:hypothetical protein